MNKKPEKQKRPPKRISPRYLENAALYYLQRYASSVENFKQILHRKIIKSCKFHGTNPEEFYPLVDKLADRYQEVGLLNDAVFAESKVNSMRRQGRSRRMIMMKLGAKGLGADDIETALEAIDQGNDAPDAELDAAITWAKKKKLGPWRKKPIEDIKDRQKELAAMARAGFSYDIAKKALKDDNDIEDEMDDDFL